MLLIKLARRKGPRAKHELLPQALLLGPVSEKPCLPGTFQPEEGASRCQTCPAGYYCDSFALKAAKECPAGYICPKGSTHAAAHYCKLGWISVKAQSSSTVTCAPCEKGKFCAERGDTEVSGTCSAVSISCSFHCHSAGRQDLLSTTECVSC